MSTSEGSGSSIGATEAPQDGRADHLADDTPPRVSAWWVVPAVVLGAGMWAGLIWRIVF